jgi:hypothetical protein
MPGCESSCRLAFAVWNRDQGIQGRILRQTRHRRWPAFLCIHPKKADAPAKCSASVSVVFRVENFERSLLALKSKGLLPDSTEKDQAEGQFAHFHDPDDNEVTIWEGI